MKIYLLSAILPLFSGFLLLTSCGLFDNSDPELEPIIPGEIIFSMADDTDAQNHQIFTMNSDGSGLQQITRLEEHEAFDPAWSPDGKEIVFTTTLNYTTLGFAIYIMNSNGTNIRPMKTFSNPSYDFVQPGSNPVWSPDGSKIAFSWCIDCELFGYNEEIFVYDIDLDTLIQLTNNPANDVVSTWTQRKSNIAFVSDRDYPDDRWRNNLFEIDIFGNNLKKITTDGNLGSFVYNPQNHSYTIKSDIRPYDWYSLDAISLDTIQNPTLNINYLPAGFSFRKWSTSGEKILLSTLKDGFFNYYVFNIESDTLIKLNIKKNISGIDIR